MEMGKRPGRSAAVVAACLVLGLLLTVGVDCGPQPQWGWGPPPKFGHGPHPGMGRPGFGHGPHPGWGNPGFGHGPPPGWGHPGFGPGPKPPGWNPSGFGAAPGWMQPNAPKWGQPGFGPGSPAKLNQGWQNAPPSYTSYPGVGAYKFHAYGVSWPEAMRVCTQEGAKMLIVNSPAEAEVIKELFKLAPNRHSPGAINSNHVWVGVQEKGTHGQFLTNDGQRLENAGFLVWSNSPPQPNDPGANDCVSFYSSGVLYDDACNIKYPFVCEF